MFFLFLHYSIVLVLGYNSTKPQIVFFCYWTVLIALYSIYKK